MNDLFIRGLQLNRNLIKDFDSYPFNIPAIKNLTQLKFNKNVTFFIGENGSGKSTMIEALAICMKLSPEGGSNHLSFETYNSSSNLSDYLTIIKSFKLPKWKYFLRAESFYTMATAYSNIANHRNMHTQSHGEEFLDIIDEFESNGLYLLDEPESALSPTNQMRLLCKIHDLTQKGAQFFIITHSPILLSYIDGEILDLDNNFTQIEYKDTKIYQTYKHFLDYPEKMQYLLFKEE